MKYVLEYPSELPGSAPEFLHSEVIREVAVAAERAGFAAVALSEHPAPSLKWRRKPVWLPRPRRHGWPGTVTAGCPLHRPVRYGVPATLSIS